MTKYKSNKKEKETLESIYQKSGFNKHPAPSKTPDALIKPLIPKNGAESYDYPDPLHEPIIGLQGEMPAGEAVVVRAVCGKSNPGFFMGLTGLGPIPGFSIGSTSWIGTALFHNIFYMFFPPIMQNIGVYFIIGGNDVIGAVNPPGAGARLVIIEPDFSMSNPKPGDFFQPIGPNWWRTYTPGSYSQKWAADRPLHGFVIGQTPWGVTPAGTYGNGWPFDGVGLGIYGNDGGSNFGRVTFDPKNVPNRGPWAPSNFPNNINSFNAYPCSWMRHSIMKVVPSYETPYIPQVNYNTDPLWNTFVPGTTINKSFEINWPSPVYSQPNPYGTTLINGAQFDGKWGGDTIMLGMRVPQAASIGSSGSISGWPLYYPGHAPGQLAFPNQDPQWGIMPTIGGPGGVLPLDYDYIDDWVFGPEYRQLSILNNWCLPYWAAL